MSDDIDNQTNIPLPSLHGSGFTARVWPVTIKPARYGGTYSGARWHAWGLRMTDVPDAAYGSDPECGGFWAGVLPPEKWAAGAEHFADWVRGSGASEYSLVVGRGSTPNEAYEKLKRTVSEYRTE